MKIIDCLAAAPSAGSPSPGLFAAPLPRLSRPNPALADTLAPDAFSLLDGYRPGAAPAVAQRPTVHLVESAAVAPI